MKANAPDKLYYAPYGDMRENHPITDNDIEYIRKDAFIEKACEWIGEFNNHHYIMRYSDSCESPLSELTEWFKNYMKKE